jgi:competence protein ComEA
MRRAMWNRLSMCVAIVALVSSSAAFAASKKTPTPAADDATTASSSKSEKVNLNTADEKTIAAVKGVGEKLAAELVKGRPYRTWDDVSKVKGVGSGKKLDSLRKVLKLSEGVADSASKAPDKSAKTPDATPNPTPSKKSSSKGSEAAAMTPTAAPAATAAPVPAATAMPLKASPAPADSSSSPSRKSSSSSSSKLAPGTKININTATKEELDALPEIGPVKAQAIVDYRKANGNFAAPEDIMKVPGIKEGTFAKIKDYVVVR